MRGTSRLIVAIIFNAALVATPAFAQIVTGPGTCVPEAQAAPEAQIRDCTAIIKGGQGGAEALSVALVLRGNAYAATGDL